MACIILLINCIFGLCLVSKPREAIEIQIKFYRLINWNMEPVSMPKEIRNTRLMGISLIIFSLGTFLYLLMR